MSDGFQGRHALVTGGGSGIGAATARALAAEGAKLSLLGRRREPLAALAEEIGGAAITCDVTDRGDMERAFAEARTANGPIDLLILNAGIADSAPFARTSRESFDAIIATNLTAVFDGAQLALPDLIEGEDKRLVIVASVAACACPMAHRYVVRSMGSLADEESGPRIVKSPLPSTLCARATRYADDDQSAERISESRLLGG